MLNVTVSGADSVLGMLDGINSDLSAAMQAAGELVAESARGSCPVDTGALRASITATSSANEAEISAGASYAGYVEFGTCKMAARPFLVPALMNKKAAIAEAIKNAVLK
jgi:HK97 gp10 family phage protein